MNFSAEFLPLDLKDLRRETAYMKAEGYRFVQTHAVNTEEGTDLFYSFMKDGALRNYKVAAVQSNQLVPSITDMFLAAFVFENEARELFGVNMDVIAIDFEGAMYDPAEINPMTFITPEQKAAKDKAKAAAAKVAAKAGDSSADARGSEGGAGDGKTRERRFVMTPQLQARLDAKMPSLSPEKVAKVEAALAALASQNDFPDSAEEARANARAEGQELADASPGEKAIDSAFAATVEGGLEENAALPAKKELSSDLQALEGRPEAGATSEGTPAELFSDETLEQMIALMDEAKAEKVIAALKTKEGE